MLFRSICAPTSRLGLAMYVTGKPSGGDSTDPHVAGQEGFARAAGVKLFLPEVSISGYSGVMFERTGSVG